MSNEGSPEGPIKIPHDVSPLRYMVAQGAGVPHRSLSSLAEARRSADAALIMEADTGGQILVTCPARLVYADEPVLQQLLCDLECITWGPGFNPAAKGTDPATEAAIYYEIAPMGSGVAGGMGGGAVVDGVWLHGELEDELQLRPQIEAVLAGGQARLDLPEGFPDCDLPSREAARRYPHARVALFSASDGRMLLSCRLSMLQIADPELIQLGRQLDAIRMESNVLPVHADPRIVYRVKDDTGLREALWVRPGPIHRRLPEITAVIRGERPPTL